MLESSIRHKLLTLGSFSDIRALHDTGSTIRELAEGATQLTPGDKALTLIHHLEPVDLSSFLAPRCPFQPGQNNPLPGVSKLIAENLPPTNRANRLCDMYLSQQVASLVRAETNSELAKWISIAWSHYSSELQSGAVETLDIQSLSGNERIKPKRRYPLTDKLAEVLGPDSEKLRIGLIFILSTSFSRSVGSVVADKIIAENQNVHNVSSYYTLSGSSASDAIKAGANSGISIIINSYMRLVKMLGKESPQLTEEAQRKLLKNEHKKFLLQQVKFNLMGISYLIDFLSDPAKEKEITAAMRSLGFPIVGKTYLPHRSDRFELKHNTDGTAYLDLNFDSFAPEEIAIVRSNMPSQRCPATIILPELISAVMDICDEAIVKPFIRGFIK